MSAKVAKTYRLPQEIIDAIDKKAATVGIDKTAVVEGVLARALLGLPEGAGDIWAHGNGPARSGDVVDLVEWLALRLKQPQAIVRMKVREGRVRVGIDPHTEETIEAFRLKLGPVIFEGETIVPGPSSG